MEIESNQESNFLNNVRDYFFFLFFIDNVYLSRYLSTQGNKNKMESRELYTALPNKWPDHLPLSVKVNTPLPLGSSLVNPNFK